MISSKIHTIASLYIKNGRVFFFVHTHTHTLIKTRAHLSTKCCCKLPERQPLLVSGCDQHFLFHGCRDLLNNAVTQFILNVNEHTSSRLKCEVVSATTEDAVVYQLPTP